VDQKGAFDEKKAEVENLVQVYPADHIHQHNLRSMIQDFTKNKFFVHAFASARSNVHDDEICSLIGPSPILNSSQHGQGIFL
jgi:hypothetical protein